jgi:hypothetical protein
MGRLLTIPATGSLRPGTRKRTLSRTALAVGPVSLQFILIIAGTLIGFFYLIQSNRVSTDSLQLKAMEQKKTLVAEQNERLQVESARLQSIQQLQKSAAQSKADQKAVAAAAKNSSAKTTEQ